MAITTTSVAWEVRTTGSDTNGGGFNTASGGTDYSQQDSPFLAFNGTTTTGIYNGSGSVTVGFLYTGNCTLNSPTLTSMSSVVNIQPGMYVIATSANRIPVGVTVLSVGTNTVTMSGNAVATLTGQNFIFTSHVVTASDIGNVLNVTGGTNFNVGRYLITGVTALGNIWTIIGGTIASGGATGMTGNMGGGLLTIANGLSSVGAAGQTIYVQSGTYNISTGLSTPTTGGGTSQTRVIGYVTNHSTVPVDGSKPIISTGSNAITAFTMTASGWQLNNFIVTSAANGVTGLSLSLYSSTNNSKFSGFATGISSTIASSIVSNCEVTAATTVGITTSGGNVIGCWVHDMTCPGITTAGGSINYNLITNCTGALSDGIACSSQGSVVLGNTVYGCGRDGLRLSSTYGVVCCMVMNNIFANNGGYGAEATVSTVLYPTSGSFNYNSYYSNALGNTNNIGIGPNTVFPSTSPFTNPSGNDFSLNAIVTGGYELRNAGFPSTMPGLSTPISYPDIGVYRHQDATPPASWSSSTAYIAGNLVSYLGNNYVSVLAGTNQLPTNTTYWAPFTTPSISITYELFMSAGGV